MLEKAFTGSKKYWGLMAVLLVIISIGLITYAKQFSEGLTITGMSRDVSWGFYIAQFTFMVGVAASAVMVVLPYYLHNYKKFSKVVILGEFLAIPSVLVCMLFIFVDMGQPLRVLNIMFFPTPNSPMFWDMISLFGYLILNVVIGFLSFDAERKGAPPPTWLKPFIYISIPWAVSIHTVTAFLYCGLEARHFWLTAILAPRFLASAFAAGPSILLMLCLLLKKTTDFDVGKEAIQKLAQIITYAMAVNVFFVLLELFTGLYSNIPAHIHHFEYLYVGHDGHASVLAPWMTVSSILAVVSLFLLLIPSIRRNEKSLVIACMAVVGSLWIDKGLGMIIAGFVPSSLGYYNEYVPSIYEILIALGIYGIGALVLTILYKIVVSIRQELE
ncbi:MAG: polysulfide reductase NrfD [Proteobacteria bacterium]|nr:polysulfide reductase NrfD [Pseudomonadota bacterium]